MHELVDQALSAVTPAEVEELCNALRDHRASYQRPVGDRWGNRGLFTAAGGTFDHKLVELVTNMHDAVVHAEVAWKVQDEGVSSLEFASLFESPEAAAGGSGRRCSRRPCGAARYDQLVAEAGLEGV